MLKILDFHFQGQRFESNTLASAPCPRDFRPIGTAKADSSRRMLLITTMSGGDRSGGRLTFTKICQGALAYSLILLREMQHIAFSPITCVGMCPLCPCVCVFVRLNASVDHMKTVEINPPFFHHHVGH